MKAKWGGEGGGGGRGKVKEKKEGGKKGGKPEEKWRKARKADLKEAVLGAQLGKNGKAKW